MASPQVLVAGIDLVDFNYVDAIQNVQEFKTFDRDKLIANTYNLKVKNFNEILSIDNPFSFFNGTSWQYIPIQVYDEFGDIVWNGIIEDIVRDHNTKYATIISTNALQQHAITKVVYNSAGWETAADAAKNILDAISFTDYDNNTIQNSITLLTANSCYIKANFNADDDITIQQALEKLGEFGCADVYSHNGIVYFQHYKPFTGGVKVNLVDKDLVTAPVVRFLTKDIINDYRIYYDGGGPAIDSTSGNIGAISRTKLGTKSLKEMGGETNDQIVFKDSISAQYIGECYINRSHNDLSTANVRAIQAIDFSIRIEHQEWIDLTSFFRLTFTDELWSEKLFEVFMFEKDYTNRVINITAYEVGE